MSETGIVQAAPQLTLKYDFEEIEPSHSAATGLMTADDVTFAADAAVAEALLGEGNWGTEAAGVLTVEVARGAAAVARVLTSPT